MVRIQWLNESNCKYVPDFSSSFCLYSSKLSSLNCWVVHCPSSEVFLFALTILFLWNHSRLTGEYFWIFFLYTSIFYSSTRRLPVSQGDIICGFLFSDILIKKSISGSFSCIWIRPLLLDGGGFPGSWTGDGRDDGVIQIFVSKACDR